MKKIYYKPQMEVVIINLTTSLMQTSAIRTINDVDIEEEILPGNGTARSRSYDWDDEDDEEEEEEYF